MQKEIENLEFVRGVNFEFIDSLKNNGIKHLYFWQTIDYVIAQTVDLFLQLYIYSRTFKAIKDFGRRTNKCSLLSMCSNRFPANSKANFFSLNQKILSGFYANA